MNTRLAYWKLGGLFVMTLIGWFQGQQTTRAQDKNKPDLDKVPRAVLDALIARFPRAKIDKWTKEKEGDFLVYDFEFQQDGRKFEADIKEDGAIHNWEKEIEAKELPKAVTAAVQKKYPKSKLAEIMQITQVKDKDESLEGYEVLIETTSGGKVEIALAPDGKILEDSGERIPKKVIAALMSRFPKAKIKKWTKEKEGGVLVYDFEFQQDGRNYEADIKEDGAIHNWEKEIAIKELPKVVREAVNKKYPQATLKEIMQITQFKDGAESLEGFEIVVHIPGGKSFEITFAPDGKVLEDSENTNEN